MILRGSNLYFHVTSPLKIFLIHKKVLCWTKDLHERIQPQGTVGREVVPVQRVSVTRTSTRRVGPGATRP